MGLADAAQQLDGGILVERLHDLALTADPLGDLERQRARDVRVGIAVAPVERFGAPALAQQQHVGVPARAEQRGARGRLRQDRVDRTRRAMDEQLDGAEEGIEFGARVGGRERDRGEDPIGGVTRSRRRLVEPHALAVFDDEVGERGAGVRREAHRARRRLARRHRVWLPRSVVRYFGAWTDTTYQSSYRYAIAASSFFGLSAPSRRA